MDAAAEGRALGGILALARVRRAALEIHDPTRLLTAARTSPQLHGFAKTLQGDAARAVELLDGTGLLAGESSAELTRLAAALVAPSMPADMRVGATHVTAIADAVFNTTLPADEQMMQVVERRFTELVHSQAPLDRAGLDELSVLGLQTGLARRHGLVTKIAREVHGDVDHVLKISAGEPVRRVQDAWSTQLAQSNDVSLAEARELIAGGGITHTNAARLRTLVLDLGNAGKLRAPTSLAWVGTAEDVLGDLARRAPLDGAEELGRWRFERMWQRAVAGTIPERDALRSELLDAARVPVTSTAQSRELLHLVEDQRGGSLFAGLPAGGSFASRDIRVALTEHAEGTGDVAAAEFARWRLLARLDDELANGVAHEAVDALRTPAGDTAPSVQLLRAEPALRQRVEVGDRLGLLGATTPREFGDVGPWLDEVDASVAARADDIPGPLLQDIDRLRGRVRSFLDGTPPGDMPVGYGHHPDYADVGRLSEQLRLADTLTGRPIETPAAALGDTLPW